MDPSDPKYERKLRDFERRMLTQPGRLDLTIRLAIGEGEEPPRNLAAYVDKVRRHAYKVTDADIAALLAEGYTEDEIFEITVAAAYGAARRRLDAGMSALSAARRPDEAKAAEADR
jgi:alkylhydroperoxidase family enzyme